MRNRKETGDIIPNWQEPSFFYGSPLKDISIQGTAIDRSELPSYERAAALTSAYGLGQIRVTDITTHPQGKTRYIRILNEEKPYGLGDFWSIHSAYSDALQKIEQKTALLAPIGKELTGEQKSQIIDATMHQKARELQRIKNQSR